MCIVLNEIKYNKLKFLSKINKLKKNKQKKVKYVKNLLKRRKFKNIFLRYLSLKKNKKYKYRYKYRYNFRYRYKFRHIFKFSKKLKFLKKNLLKFSKLRYLNLKKKYCILHLNSVYSNFFFTVTNLDGMVLLSCSSGQVSFNRLKKVKISPMIIYSLIKKIKNFLFRKKIFNLIIFIKTDLNNKIMNVFKYLKFSKFKVKFVFFLKPIPHSKGMRKKKLRRL